MDFKGLSKYMSGVGKSINRATYRSINKTLTKTNSRFKKAVSKDTGLTAKAIGKRFRVRKATSTNFNGNVSMGTKYGVSLDNFKPKVKIIRKSNRKYKGVTVKIGKQARAVVPGGFLATVKSGKSLVLARTTANRYPVKTVKHDIYEAAETHRAALKSFAQDEYKKQFNDQIKYELSR